MNKRQKIALIRREYEEKLAPIQREYKLKLGLIHQGKIQNDD
jgi:hypothetical protein